MLELFNILNSFRSDKLKKYGSKTFWWKIPERQLCTLQGTHEESSGTLEINRLIGP